MDTTDPNIWTSIEQCPIHNVQWDTECSGCESEMTAMTAVLEQLHAEARHRIGGLQRAGVPFSPLSIDMQKVEILWEQFFQGRNGFLAEGELARRTVEMVKQMQAQAGPQLVVPKGSNSGLTVVRDGKGKR